MSVHGIALNAKKYRLKIKQKGFIAVCNVVWGGFVFIIFIVYFVFTMVR